MFNQKVDGSKLMADAKFYESYARYIEEEARYETWNESVERVMAMHRRRFSDRMSPELETLFQKVEKAYKEKLILGAQRALQFGGEQLEKNPAKMYNCTASYLDRPEFFGESLFLMLSGCGIGFSVQKHHIAKLPKLKQRTKSVKKFTVPDSIEG